MQISAFLFATASFVSGAFSLGAISVLYLQFRTRVVRFLLLFVLSLFLISGGFWTNALARIPSINMSAIQQILLMFQSAGSAINVIILPFLTAALINLSLNPPAVLFIWIWNGLFITGAGAAYLFPGKIWLLPLMSILFVLTILFWLAVLTIGLSRLSDRNMRKPLLFFVIITFLFIPLLILDILITSLPIESLAFLDNFSLPLYITAINGGSFLFGGSFLNRAAYVDDGQATDAFRKAFGISPRETDIVNKLLLGKSNREIGEELFISIKTVENHLGNIYRKTDVTGRNQLIHMLHTWEKS